MFKSFFPSPRYFFISAVIWIALNMVLWYSGGSTWGVSLDSIRVTIVNNYQLVLAASGLRLLYGFIFGS